MISQNIKRNALDIDIYSNVQAATHITSVYVGEEEFGSSVKCCASLVVSAL